jgi:hypothetical protein
VSAELDQLKEILITDILSIKLPQLESFTINETRKGLMLVSCLAYFFGPEDGGEKFRRNFG